jgi:hypothetical protein
MHEPNWTYDGTNGDTYGGLFQSWGLGVHVATNAPTGDVVFPDRVMRGHIGEAYGLVSDMYFGPGRDGGTVGLIFATNGCFNGYELGNVSAYYTVEEEVFKSIYDDLAENCEL